MRRRQPLPTLWLMTDERADAGLDAALKRLPRGAGVIFRHYATAERRARYEQVRRIARARGMVLVLAGSPRLAIAWKADGAHGRSRHVRAARRLIRTAPVHGRREMLGVKADLVLLSPLFPTRSHPGGRTLGPVRFGMMAKGRRTIALGGMTEGRFRRLRRLGAYGWAAIDGLTPRLRT
ncbi:thiamine-phosphate pyrophosphorylase [Sphingomonas vulcanisoli]|uniref:Thiamine-phosphate pyrophosphorylase n=1 Tax=Sphingomonas vulcanisoli TaxID=1658060 RepID=A0ABX0TPC7_9SPHN|nr:thiamine phosphate synthase [Sphingomonas vulcanisoli]NIJ07387.1 thiamine-phosphate pyrophosphorylase [Sphingomonas vulcanisoli]